MIIAIFFILGLIVGSFLNVVVHRLHMAEDFIWESSHCPHCKKPIRWYDNVPLLSFILLKGICRDCKEKISLQYPMTEFFTGVVFSLIGYTFFTLVDSMTWIIAGYYLLIAGALISVLVYDFLYMEIPTIIIWLAAGAALLFNLFFDWQINSGAGVMDSMVISGIVGALVAFIFFFALSFFSKEKWMGMGDAYLAIPLGLILGWPKMFLALFLSFLIGSIYGIILMIIGKKKMKSQIPFAPFLVIGTFIALLFYIPIIDWYFGLF